MIKEFTDRQQKAKAQFIDDIKMLLTPEQLELFPKVEHHRRRELFLHMGMVSGAGRRHLEHPGSADVRRGEAGDEGGARDQ